MKATITLEIIYPEETICSPDTWDWQKLLDLGWEESITVIKYEEVKE
jgi:hypothetical protein